MCGRHIVVMALYHKVCHDVVVTRSGNEVTIYFWLAINLTLKPFAESHNFWALLSEYIVMDEQMKVH